MDIFAPRLTLTVRECRTAIAMEFIIRHLDKLQSGDMSLAELGRNLEAYMKHLQDTPLPALQKWADLAQATSERIVQDRLQFFLLEHYTQSLLNEPQT